MEKNCSICHDTAELDLWRHPGTGEELTFCRYCREAIVGVCRRCNEVLVKFDRFGMYEDGSYICSRCAEAEEDGPQG